MNRTAWTVWVVSTVTTFAVLESKGVRSKRVVSEVAFFDVPEKGPFFDFSEMAFSEGAPQQTPLPGYPRMETPATGTPYMAVQYPTLTACLRMWLGIYPMRARGRVCRPLFTALLAWFFAHIMYGVPWPFEHEVMQRASKQVRRQKW